MATNLVPSVSSYLASIITDPTAIASAIDIGTRLLHSYQFFEPTIVPQSIEHRAYNDT